MSLRIETIAYRICLGIISVAGAYSVYLNLQTLGLI